MYESKLSNALQLLFVVGGLSAVIALAVISHNEYEDRAHDNQTHTPIPGTNAPEALPTDSPATQAPHSRRGKRHA